MNLLIHEWIPVRDRTQKTLSIFLSYFDILNCDNEDLEISLPRDDFEFACLQLLVSLTQVFFLPKDRREWIVRRQEVLSRDFYEEATQPRAEWFDLDHPEYPFMQCARVDSPGRKTRIQKLMTGMPEGDDSTTFFNGAGEISSICAPVAAIALFNQAVNCPSFGGGFHLSLRGNSPITVLVRGKSLRDTIWRNVLTRETIDEEMNNTDCSLDDPMSDLPTWVHPIQEQEEVDATSIGLLRGLFWQPAHVKLVSSSTHHCDLLSKVHEGCCYDGFYKKQFRFKTKGVWRHPHGIVLRNTVKPDARGQEYPYASFGKKGIPIWVRLAECIVPLLGDNHGIPGSSPPAVVIQTQKFSQYHEQEETNLLVGGYSAKQALILERRHEMLSLATGWHGHDQCRLSQLVKLGKKSEKILSNSLKNLYKPRKNMRAIGVDLSEMARLAFYNRTQDLFINILSDEQIFANWSEKCQFLLKSLHKSCESIYENLTASYAKKLELIEIITFERHSQTFRLNNSRKNWDERLFENYI